MSVPPEERPVPGFPGDKTNNSAANLRYGTRSENELDKVRHRQIRAVA